MTDNLENKINGKIQLLIVDDDLILGRMSKRMIEECSNGKYEAHIAQDGKEAIEILKNHDYPLVITDWDMLEVNGLNLYEWAKSNKKPLPQFIFVSGDMTIYKQEILDRAKILYLEKPFKAESYLNLIEKVLREKPQ